VRIAWDTAGVGALGRPVLADGLAGGDDVVGVEAQLEAGSAVPGRSEGDPLLGDRGIRVIGVVGDDELGDVHQVAGLGGAASTGVDPGISHVSSLDVERTALDRRWLRLVRR
jgi:hypothetical protein